jgi:hypothetical protein
VSFAMTQTGGGARNDMQCDGFPLNADGCLGRVELNEDNMVPAGWVQAPDPFLRVSRATNSQVVLHLCPKCAELEHSRG